MSIEHCSSMLRINEYYWICAHTLHGEIIHCYDYNENIQEGVKFGNKKCSHFIPGHCENSVITKMYEICPVHSKHSTTQHLNLDRKLFTSLFNTSGGSKSVLLLMSEGHLIRWFDTKKPTSDPEILLDLKQDIVLVGTTEFSYEGESDLIVTKNALVVIGASGLLVVYFNNETGDCDNIYLSLHGTITSAACHNKGIIYSTEEGLFYTSLTKVKLNEPCVCCTYVRDSAPCKAVEINECNSTTGECLILDIFSMKAVLKH